MKSKSKPKPKLVLFRQRGFDHIITKRGIKAASADFGLIAVAYNLKRLLNILSKDVTSQKPTKRSKMFYNGTKLISRPYIPIYKKKAKNRNPQSISYKTIENKTFIKIKR